MTIRGPRTSPVLFRRWRLLLASWILKSMRSRRCGLDERTSELPTCSKGHPIFPGSAAHDLPKIIGLKGMHSPEALCQQAGLSFCPWCGKEGQNEDTIVNHLWISHYHLGLVCSHCLKYFTICADTMCCHSQLCNWTSAGIDDDDDQEEGSNPNDNGEDDFTFS